MPGYFYQCEQCHQTQEYQLPVDQASEWQVCPLCGGLARKTTGHYASVRYVAPSSVQEVSPSTEDHVCHAGCALHHWEQWPVEDKTVE